jgi:hypothetical protein
VRTSSSTAEQAVAESGSVEEDWEDCHCNTLAQQRMNPRNRHELLPAIAAILVR